MQAEQIRNYLQRTIDLSREGMDKGIGGPFGCVIVKDGAIVAEGCNRVTSDLDPTAHAEMVAIRKACLTLGTFLLTDCLVFCSCEPCPMCLGAIYWARPAAVYYATTKGDAAGAGFDDDFIYREIERTGPQRSIPFVHVPLEEGKQVFEAWKSKEGKTPY
jgi:guanine deaminase